VHALFFFIGVRADLQNTSRFLLPAAVRMRLKKVVNEEHWKRAEEYLDHFLKERAKTGSPSLLLAGAVTAPVPSSSAASHDAIKRNLAAIAGSSRSSVNTNAAPSFQALQDKGDPTGLRLPKTSPATPDAEKRDEGEQSNM
jgi:hypothetical protein